MTSALCATQGPPSRGFRPPARPTRCAGGGGPRRPRDRSIRSRSAASTAGAMTTVSAPASEYSARRAATCSGVPWGTHRVDDPVHVLPVGRRSDARARAAGDGRVGVDGRPREVGAVDPGGVAAVALGLLAGRAPAPGRRGPGCPGTASTRPRRARRGASRPRSARRPRPADAGAGSAAGRAWPGVPSTSIGSPAKSRDEDVERLVGAPPALADGHPARRELHGVLAADPDAELEAPAGDAVEGRGHLRRERRGVERQQRHGAEQAHAGGDGRGGGEGDERVGRRARRRARARRSRRGRSPAPRRAGRSRGTSAGSPVGGRTRPILTPPRPPATAPPPPSSGARRRPSRRPRTPTPERPGLDHRAGVGDLLVGRRERLVGERDLRGVDADLAVVAEVAADVRVGAERLGVAGGDDGLVQRPTPATAAASTTSLRANSTSCPPGGAPAADRGDVVLGAEVGGAAGRAPAPGTAPRPRAVSRPPTTGRPTERARRSVELLGRLQLGQHDAVGGRTRRRRRRRRRTRASSGALTRTSTSVPPSRGSSATARTAASRADSLSPAATASSRSTATASGAHRGTLATMSGRAPGTNSRLRGDPHARRPPVHQARAPAAADELVALVVGAVLEHHDPGVGPRRRLPRRHDLGLHPHGVAVEHRRRERRRRRARAGRRSCPSVSSGTESPTTSARVNMLLTSGRPNSVPAAYCVVQVQRRGVHRHGREQHVVGLGDRAPGGVLDDEPDSVRSSNQRPPQAPRAPPPRGCPGCPGPPARWCRCGPRRAAGPRASAGAWSCRCGSSASRR